MPTLRILFWPFLAACCTLACRCPCGRSGPEKAHPAQNRQSLSVQPAALTLMDSRDARSFIVTGKTAAGYAVDLSLAGGGQACRADCARG